MGGGNSTGKGAVFPHRRTDLFFFFFKVSFKAQRGCNINYILEGKRYCHMNRESKGHKRLRDKAGS